jgi:hypothetical protein
MRLLKSFVAESNFIPEQQLPVNFNLSSDTFFLLDSAPVKSEN